MKQVLGTALKLALVGGLIYWLVASERLDFGQLRIFWERPDILVEAVSLWLVGYLLLGSLRWYVLLRGVDIRIPFRRAVHFQLIGFFFNTAVPGAVGGDIVKAMYVIREQTDQGKTRALLTVLLDRIVGLACLFVLAGAAVLLNLSFFTDNPALRPLAGFLGIGFVGLLFGLGIVFYPHAPGKDPVARFLSLEVPGFSLLSKIYDALRIYRQRPMTLVLALLISCVIQTASFLYMLAITHALTGQSPEPAIFASVYAIGVMATAIPLAPGGLGVGHVAFDRLYHLAGMNGGANVFNVFVLMQLALNLFGVIPYLFHRRKPLPEPAS